MSCFIGLLVCITALSNRSLGFLLCLYLCRAVGHKVECSFNLDFWVNVGICHHVLLSRDTICIASVDSGEWRPPGWDASSGVLAVWL